MERNKMKQTIAGKPEESEKQKTGSKFFFQTLEFDLFENAYPPSEDSELLAESVSIPGRPKVLDLGCGSGIQGIACAKNGAGSVTFSDIHPNCLKNARHNFQKNKKQIPGNPKTIFIQSNLFGHIVGTFDCIIFNPPYVPSEPIKWIDTDGGKKGREILDQFLGQAGKFLKPNGRIFFLQTSLNGIRATKQKLKKLGFRFEIANRKKLFFEELIVFRLEKK